MLLIILVLQLLSTVLGYSILCVFPVPSRSHDTLGRGVVNALLKAGHQVTWVTPYVSNKAKENLTIIDASNTLRFQQDLTNIDKAEQYSDVFAVKNFISKVNAATVQNKYLHAALLEKEFDAVVTEWFFSDAYAGIAAVQQAPWILFSSVAMNPYLEYLVDEIRSVSILPMLITDYPLPMNFFQRLSTMFLGSMLYAESMYHLSDVIDLYNEFAPVAKGRNVEFPPFTEALHNVSILFLNSHTSYALAQSLPPNVIEIGGFHIDESIPPLPKDLQEILDSSTQGVVYFSMGSILQSSSLSEKKKKDVLQVLGELPYTVVWKFEDQIEDLPKNVHIRPWLPQLSVLAHPNTKLFITHGGLLSILEAIHCGVPLLMIPIYGDQRANAIRADNAGFARRLTYSDNLAQDMRIVLNEMLRNQSYYERAQYLSMLFRNRPIAPSKLISHYVELAIESNGAHHLRSKAQLYEWYQRWMIDQLLFIFLVIYLIYKIFRLFISFVVNILVKNKKKYKKN